MLGCDRKCISYFWKTLLSSVPSRQKGNYQGGFTPVFRLKLCDCLVRALGTEASPRPGDCGIDFRISSVTLLDPENDRGPLCY